MRAQADLDAMQQDMERSTQERGTVTAALQADMARIAGCLNQARSVLSDHAQQLGRLSQLPVELSGVAEEVTSVQRDVAGITGQLEIVAVLPAQLDSIGQQVTALGSKQEDTVAAMERGMTSTGQQVEAIQADLKALQAQASMLGRQYEKYEGMASRLTAAEVHLDGIEQVSRGLLLRLVVGLCRGVTAMTDMSLILAVCKNVLLIFCRCTGQCPP